jgi:hypothetical protein
VTSLAQTLGRRHASTFALAAAGVVLLLGFGGAAAQAPQSASWAVLGIHQSNYTTEQSAFTVGVQVADPGSVSLAYFTFCQLSSPVCYTPVEMSLVGTNWFEGTTERMASYDGMVVGVRAGYNITITYANNTTVREPDLPNSFSNLTVATEVGGEYMFEMSVGNQLYGLTGDVMDATTHAGIAGASVSLTPGNGTVSTTTTSGAYSFRDLANGTYTISVAVPGYPSSSTTAVVKGANLTKDLNLSSGGIVTPPPAKTTSKTSPNFLTSPTGLAVIGVVVVVVVVAVVSLMMSRKGKAGAPPTAVPGAKPAGGSSVEPPK